MVAVTSRPVGGTWIQLFVNLFYFIVWGNGGKCIVHLSAQGAPCVGSSTAFRWAFSPVGQSAA